jgi:hypothetical protein
MKKISLLFVYVTFFLNFSFSADWELHITDEAGLALHHKNSPVLEAHYVFWGQNWEWAGVKMAVVPPSEHNAYQLSGTVSNIDLSLTGQATIPDPRQLQVDLEVVLNKALTNIIGGGLEFNLKLDAPSLANAGDPILLLDNRGWEWPVGGGQSVRVMFSAPIASVAFERGNKGSIRTLFVGTQYEKGDKETVSMTVTLPKDGRVVPSPRERYARSDRTRWHKNALLHDQSPVDLRFLNHKPAGKFGFVKAQGEDLVFENGEKARFWSGNIAAYAIFAEKKDIEVQARRIAQLGYNLMRFHHHDSTSWVGRTAIDKTKTDSQHLDEEFMNRLDYWIQCLKEEGVYVWLDLHVGRQFKEGDEIPGFAELQKDNGEGKGFNFVNRRIEELMQDFNAAYLNHVNPYTGLAYKNDPAIMGLMITNENDLTGHFGNKLLPDKKNPYHTELFEAELEKFAKKTGFSASELWQTWLPGASKIFLADLEYQWYARMMAHLQKEGVRVPVSTTQMWGNMNIYGLPALTAGTIIDTHSYGAEEALHINPVYKHNYVTYIATGHAYAMPLSITEWNVRYPWTDRFTAPLYLASISALQEWDAPMIYNYSQRPFGTPNNQDQWSTFTDPALTGLMPAAALLYRKAHVSPGKNTYCVQLNRESCYGKKGSHDNMVAIRTLVEQSKVFVGLPDVPELDWDSSPTVEPSVQVVHDVTQSFIPAGRTSVTSDTNELHRDWNQGIQTINTPKTQAAQGWIGGKEIDLSELSLRITTPKATVAVSSMDNRPIARSQQMLITVMARVEAQENNRMPLLSEPVEGRMTIRAEKGLRLFPLRGDGTRLAVVSLSMNKAGTAYTLDLPVAEGTHWYLLTR